MGIINHVPIYNSICGSRVQSTTPHLPFIVKSTKNLWSDELSNWLLDIGKNNKEWEWEWINGNYMFGFKSEEDKVRFILRWL